MERFLREKGASCPGKDEGRAARVHAVAAFSLYEYRGDPRASFRGPAKGQVRLREPTPAEDFDVTERRQMHGLETGDFFEARLVPVDRTYSTSPPSFTYHPREVFPVIRREIKRRKKQGAVDTRALCWDLERMSPQHERFRNVSVENIYNFETPFLSKRPPAPEVRQGG